MLKSETLTNFGSLLLQRMWSIKIIFLAFLVFFSLDGNAQLPEYLRLEDPKILNHSIASGGRVWNTLTKDIILSVDHKTSLTSNSIYYSDSTTTYIHSNTDGKLIAQIPGRNYSYNSLSSILWTYSNNKFDAYSEIGKFIISLTLSANNIYPFQHEIRYTKGNSVYKYLFTNSHEQPIGDFAGTFSTWFFDGEYFLTTQESIIRLYDKNATLIKLVDVTSAENVGGNGNYFWTFPNQNTQFSELKIFNVNGSAVSTYPTGTLAKVVSTSKYIALFQYALPTFSIIELTDTEPKLSVHKGAGPYLISFDADIYGHWTTANQDGVVNYGNLTDQPETLNLGSIRAMFGTKNGHLGIATSSGHVLTYTFNGMSISRVDTININARKVMLSQDGKYLAASGKTFESRFSEGEFSLHVYDVASQSLVKKWHHNDYYAQGYLVDFDFSLDGSLVSQKIEKRNGSGSAYFNYLSSVYSNDSIFINHDNNISAPKISPGGNYVLTSYVDPDYYKNGYSDKQDFYKLYNTAGVLLNGANGFSPGWISDNRFICNRPDTIICRRAAYCTKYYTPNIYSVDVRVDTGYVMPDSLSVGDQMLKTSSLDDAAVISDHELYINNFNYINNPNIIDIKTGKILFAFDTVPSLSAPVGSDHIVYIKDNALQIINWRLLSNSVWYKDSDGDGFGDPGVTKMFYKKPAGFVHNSSDCNDLDSSINPDTKWYADVDGDGFGDSGTIQKQCEKPIGFVKDNTDCNDSNDDLTPSNLCIVTGLEDTPSVPVVFPNPSSGVYRVKHNKRIINFKIINTSGQRINLDIGRDNEFYIIDMSKERKGLYLLNMRIDDNDINYKLIKTN